PAVAVTAGRAAQRRRVAATRWLGKTERAEAPAVHETRQPARALIQRAETDERSRDDPAVHRHTDRERGPDGGKLLEDERERDRGRAEAAVPLRHRHAEDAQVRELPEELPRQLPGLLRGGDPRPDRKSTRLNASH